ncbi:MAG: DNA-processing protein DprA [Clostridia bacterium]|nr:DNA-processing protein DprA [Clostridia bacterium]
MEINHQVLWLWAKDCLGYNNKKLLRAVEFFGSIEELYQSDDYAQCEFLLDKEVKLLNKKNLRLAWETYGLCEENQIGILTLDDGMYPPLLREISNPPCPLFFKGHLRSCLNAPLLTIVGTRKHNGYGEAMTKELTVPLCCCGFTIVTGLAGLDTVACKSALESDGRVVAVLPFGILANSGHSTVRFKQILAKGALISEYFPKTKTQRHSYHERNRILSGISHGTVVVQAPQRSGALMTANYALEQNRDLFALMANADATSAGSNRLIKDGCCYPITDYVDILQVYLPRFADRLKEVTDPAEKVFSLRDELNEKKVNEFKKKHMKGLTPEEQAVFSLLSTDECTTDYLIEHAGLPVHEVLQSLTTLEFRGLAVSCPGSKFKVIL